MSRKDEIDELDKEERAEFARLAEEGLLNVEEMLDAVNEKFRDRYKGIIFNPHTEHEPDIQ